MKKPERLTERIRGVAQPVWRDESIPCKHAWFCPKDKCTSPNACDFAIIIDRLAAYEDTGLLPEDVIRLKRENGRLKEKLKSQKERLTGD